MADSTSYAKYSGIIGALSGVTSLNAETGAINLVAGAGITVTPSGQNITIAATGAELMFGDLTTTSPNLTVGNGASAVHGTGTTLTLTGASLIESTSAVLTIGSGANAVLGTGTTITVKQSSTSQSGYLSSTDWNTFNGKQASGSYITALTGDVTASGPGSVAATLATVNANVGSFGSSTAIPAFTVNAKGLITAASTSVVIAPAGTLSGATLNSTVVTSSLTALGTVTTGTWSATAISAAKGGFGADVSAQSGVPLFASGVATFTGTTGTGTFVRATSPSIATATFTGATAFPGSTTIDASGKLGIGKTPTMTVDISAAAASCAVTSSTGTNTVYYNLHNTGGDTYFGIDSSTGGSIFSFTGNVAFATLLGTSAATPLQFVTNSLLRHSIQSDGTQRLVGLTSGTVPTNAASAMGFYQTGTKFVLWYNDAGTVRYKSLDMSGTGVTWVAATTAP